MGVESVGAGGAWPPVIVVLTFCVRGGWPPKVNAAWADMILFALGTIPVTKNCASPPAPAKPEESTHVRVLAVCVQIHGGAGGTDRAVTVGSTVTVATIGSAASAAPPVFARVTAY